MIPRYSRPEMAAIWSPETRFRIWFEIEAHALDAMADLGIAPKSAAKTVREKGEKAVFDIARIDEVEREVKHDVIAFLTQRTELVGPDALDPCGNVPDDEWGLPRRRVVAAVGSSSTSTDL